MVALHTSLEPVAVQEHDLQSTNIPNTESLVVRHTRHLSNTNNWSPSEPRKSRAGSLIILRPAWGGARAQCDGYCDGLYQFQDGEESPSPPYFPGVLEGRLQRTPSGCSRWNISSPASLSRSSSAMSPESASSLTVDTEGQTSVLDTWLQQSPSSMDTMWEDAEGMDVVKETLGCKQRLQLRLMTSLVQTPPLSCTNFGDQSMRMQTSLARSRGNRIGSQSAPSSVLINSGRTPVESKSQSLSAGKGVAPKWFSKVVTRSKSLFSRQ